MIGEWDNLHSGSARLRVHHMEAGQFWGRFNEVTGTFRHAGDDAAALTLDVTITVDSVDTDNSQRDRHLKSPDFFNAREYPTMTFKSSSAKLISAGNYGVKGTLTIHGVPRPVSAQLEWTGTSDKSGDRRCGLEATFEINRGDFDVTHGIDDGTLGNATKIIVGLEGVKK